MLSGFDSALITPFLGKSGLNLALTGEWQAAWIWQHCKGRAATHWTACLASTQGMAQANLVYAPVAPDRHAAAAAAHLSKGLQQQEDKVTLC